MDKQRRLSLLSSDGRAFIVDEEDWAHSATIVDMVDVGMFDENNAADDEVPVIPLPNVTASVMEVVVEYLDALRSGAESGAVSAFSAARLRDDAEGDEAVFELMLAANYLVIKPLLDLTCAHVAGVIRGKTPEEIRQRFKLANDFSPEEEAAVRMENEWAFGV
jgi:S-phase kinase-associated protein 1